MKNRLLIGTFILASNLSYADDQMSELKRRIELLERQQNELFLLNSESAPNVRSFLKDDLTLGGFFESSITADQGPDTNFQATNTTNLLGLNSSAAFSSRLHFVSQFVTGLSVLQQNPQNDSRVTQREFSGVSFGSVLTQGFLSYSLGAQTIIQAGLGYVPFGYAAQQREIVLFVRRNGPQLIRTNELFSPLWSGVHLSQRFNKSKSVWGYNLYSFTRFREPKLPGIGSRAWWSTSEERLTVGLSMQSAKYWGHVEETFGLDLKFNVDDFVLTSEFARHYSKVNDDTWSAYIEPGFYIFEQEVLFYMSFDYAQNSTNKTSGTLADPFEKIEYSTGVNWLPTSYTRLRLGLTYNDYIHEKSVTQTFNRDFTSLDLSVGVAF